MFSPTLQVVLGFYPHRFFRPGHVRDISLMNRKALLASIDGFLPVLQIYADDRYERSSRINRFFTTAKQFRDGIV